MPHTNFLQPPDDDPVRPFQRETDYTPQVKIFSAEDPADIEVAINLWFDTLATPINPDERYYVVSIDYAAGDVMTNEILFSALVYYQRWEVV